MVSLAAGSVVLVRFPFSDLSSSKLRPAVVLASVGKDDWILCQITSNAYTDPTAIEIEDQDFVLGGLHRKSYARSGKLFTANTSVMVRHIGTLKPDIKRKLIDSVVALLKPNG